VMIELSRRVITQITTPMVSVFFEEGQIHEIKRIYRQISINQMAIGILFFAGITCNMESVYLLMPNGDTYRSGTAVVYLIGLSKLIDMSFSNNGEIITMSDYYRFNVFGVTILGLLMIGFNYLLIPSYGINGAAIATLSATLCYNMIKMYFIKVKLGCSPFTFSNLVLLLVGGVIFLLGRYLPRMDSPYLDIMVRSAVIASSFGILVYSLNISKEINGMINAMWKKVVRSVD